MLFKGLCKPLDGRRSTVTVTLVVTRQAPAPSRQQHGRPRQQHGRPRINIRALPGCTGMNRVAAGVIRVATVFYNTSRQTPVSTRQQYGSAGSNTAATRQQHGGNTVDPSKGDPGRSAGDFNFKDYYG